MREREKQSNIAKKAGLIIGALILLYVVLRPFLGSSHAYVNSALADASDASTSSLNSQTIYLPQPTETMGIGGTDTLSASNDQISVYVVHPGDTLSEIANMFGVTENTIIWANDLKRGAPLQANEHLVILPISGVQYTVLKGDTLAKIAAKLRGDIDEIKSYNGIASDADLTAGMELIVPDGELAQTATVSRRSKAGVYEPLLGPRNLPNKDSYYSDPLPGHHLTQGLHGHNGVDLALPEGAHILAAAAGEVIISKNNGGWNGGYGNYVVIAHDNGTQTLYAHMLRTLVSVGEQVSQGQVIGQEGSTGESTGPHLHFEVRGARNPFQ